MSQLLNVIESILSAADADRTKGVHLDREILDLLEEAVLSEDGINGLRLAWKAFKRAKGAEAELEKAKASEQLGEDAYNAMDMWQMATFRDESGEFAITDQELAEQADAASLGVIERKGGRARPSPKDDAAKVKLEAAMELLTEIYESREVGSYSDMGKRLAAMVDDLAPEVDE